jgi:hypothetical protein
MSLRFQMLAHVTYVVSQELFESIQANPDSEPVTLMQRQQISDGKKSHLRRDCSEQNLLVLNHPYPIEYISFVGDRRFRKEPSELPFRRGEGSWTLEISSASFDSAVLESIGLLFGVSPVARSLTLRSPAAMLKLLHDSSAPTFSPFLDGGPEPVSLGLLCRGLLTLGPGIFRPATDLVSDTVVTPAGRFAIALVKVGDVWIELLERLERHAG